MTCDKITFNTFDEAQKVVNKANNTPRIYSTGKRVNRRQSYKPKRVYKCDVCGLYHLTSMKKK
jgi:hypothetical protein